MKRTSPTGDATTVPPDVVLGAHTFQHALATEPNRESQRRVQFSRHEVQTFMEEGGVEQHGEKEKYVREGVVTREMTEMDGVGSEASR